MKGAQSKQRLSKHIKYIKHREFGPEETKETREMFGKDKDEMSREEASAEIMDHAKSSVAYHKMVLSPDKSEEQVYDWKQWTRETMADLEEKKGLKLHWVAVHHSNTENEHVHVVLSGGGENERGDLRQVRMDVEDYKFMNERGHEHSEHEFNREMKEHMKEAEREEEFNRELYKKEPERQRETPRQEQQPEREAPRQERKEIEWER